MKSTSGGPARVRGGLSALGVAGELAEEVEHAVGAVDDDVGELEQGALLARRRSRPAGSGSPRRGGRRPPRTPRRRRGRRRRRGTPPASSLLDQGRGRRWPLCMPGRADLDHVAAGLDRPGRARRPGPSSSGSSRSNAAAGSSSRRVCTATARPFSSTNASPASCAPQHAGAARAEEGRQPVRRPRRDDPAVGGGPALVAVLAEDVAAPCRRSPMALPTSSSPPRASAWRAGRPVITAIARDHVGELDQHVAGASGWMWARLRVVDDRGQGAVEVEARPRPRRPRGPGRRTAARPRWSVNSMAPPNHGRRRAGSPSHGTWRARQAASAVRITVSRSRRIGSIAGLERLDAEVERQHLGGGLEPRREVDGRGRGWCRTSCRSRRRSSRRRWPVAATPAGEAGDAGVVVDLDVDLAALDRRLGLLRLLRSGSGLRGVGVGRRLRRETVVTSRSVGSWSWVATSATPAIATAMMLSITTGDGKTTPRSLRRRTDAATLVRARSRGGGPSAGAGGRRAGGAAGGPAAGRPRAPRDGRSGR